MADGNPSQYIRVSKHASLPFEAFPPRLADGLSDIKLIDIDLRSVADLELIWEALHELPDRLAGASRVVFRWPTIATEADRERIQQFAKEALQRADALGNAPNVEVFAPVVGGPALHVAADGTPQIDLLTLRDLEIASLLDAREAKLKGDDYHFKLPSGSHAETFVRVANALRTIRDVWVVTSWMVEFLTPRCGFVLDSASLTPIAVQLSSFAAASGFELGDVGVLDNYPNSLVDVQRVVEQASSTGKCLALLSVDSTGTTRRMFESELRRRNPDRWRLHVLVSSAPPSDDVAGAVSTWHRTNLHAAATGQDCASCKDATRAFVVSIDGRAYYPQPNLSPAFFVPSLAEGQNRAFWELADRQRAVMLEVLPSASAQARRSERTPLGVRVNFERLIADVDALSLAVSRRLTDLHDDTSDGKSVRHLAKVFAAVAATTVVYVEQSDASPEALAALLRLMGIANNVRIVTDEKALKSTATEGDCILAFSWGTLTGTKLKDMRVTITDAYHGKRSTINGLCLHARPPSEVEWRAAINSFRPGFLGAIWLSYVPWFSPLRSERELLERLESPSETALARLALLDASDPSDRLDSDMHALWGIGKPWNGQAQLRETSVYGHELSANAAYAAVGAALQRSRNDNTHSARRSVVHLARVGAPYFDAILIACILRWIRPAEAWWGADADEQRGTLDTIWDAGGHSPEEQAVLIPELFIAAALGKMPRAVVTRLVERHENYLQQGGWSTAIGSDTARRQLAAEAARIAAATLGM